MILKNIFKILALFVVGIVGGIFADQILWPYFIERPLFYEYRLERLDRPIYVTEKKEIKIQENVALQEAVEKVKSAVIGVRATTTREVMSGSGLVVTSDGLMITLDSLLPKGNKFYFWNDGQWLGYQILKRDSAKNLALVKLEQGGLKTASFADYDKIKMGQRVFLVGVIFPATTSDSAIFRSVNDGIISNFDENFIQTNIFGKDNLAGSPLFDIEGNVVGLNFIDPDGRIRAISVKIIREFLGF